MEGVTLKQLEYAVAVADHAHFGRAAEGLHVSQPGLSAQVRELERRLGVVLFERTPQGVRLTPAGAEIVERARDVRRAVDEVALAAAVHRDGLRGAVRLAAIPTMAPYLLPTAVRGLHDRWPAAELQLRELQTAELVRAIEAGDVDLGLLAIPYDTGRLHVEELVDEPFALAVPADHALAGAGAVPVGVLADLPVLLLDEGHCLHDHAKAACAIAGQADGVVVHSAGLATLTQMVAAGMGTTLLPASTVELETRTGTGVAWVPFDPPVPGRTVALAWRRTDPRADAFAAAADDLRPALAQRVAGV